MSHKENFRFHDTVLVKGFRVDASIGVFEWEKQIKQSLVFDAELYSDFSTSGSSDAIEDAVDYSAVCGEIAMFVSRKHYQLLEYLAEQISQHLLSKFAIDAISLAIYKPGAVPSTEYVGVKMFRSKVNHNSAEQSGRC